VPAGLLAVSAAAHRAPAALDELLEEGTDPRLARLLSKLDAAIGELQSGTWGICRTCHETVSSEEMETHPLLSVCLECMSAEQKNELERDLESAARVQRSLLPPVSLNHDGWQVEHLWEPFGMVSGDHVDIVRPAADSEPLHLLLGDVAGKGLAASLLQSQLHALFRALATTKTTLAGLLGSANRLFHESTEPGFFATLVVARLFPDGRAVFANAGHPRPLLSDRRGVRPIDDASLPLGTIGDVDYTEHEIRLQPGDTLFLYTDGLTETWRNGVEYGVGRAAAALRRAGHLPLREMLAACRGDLERFAEGSRRGDDLTMVAVRRE
jgi:sigma-B regulation protein RsbU (phosphoserine phosphatase)